MIEEAGRFLANSYYVGRQGYDARYPVEKSPYRIDFTPRWHELHFPQKDVYEALATFLAVERTKYADWMTELAPFVQMFVDTHPNHKLFRHELFLVYETATYPWGWGEEGFSEWREAPGTMHIIAGITYRAT